MLRNKRVALSSIAFSIALASGFHATASFSADSDCQNKIADAAAASTSTASGGDSTSSVVATLKSEQQQLRRMGEAIKRAKRAASDVLQECTQPVEMMGEIDIIGQDVIPIMPATAEGFGNNYLPPRPKYMNLHMAQLEALVPILKDDVESLAIPDVEKDYAKQPLDELNGNYADFKKLYATLVTLTKDKVDYNVQELMSTAHGIDATCKGMDAARKKLLHEESKAEKQEEKNEKKEGQK